MRQLRAIFMLLVVLAGLLLLVGGCVALLTEMSHIQTLPAPALSPDWIDRGESRPAT